MNELTSVRHAYRPDRSFGVRIGDVALSLHTNVPTVSTRLREYFAPYLSAGMVPDAPAVHLVQGEPVYDAARLRDIPRRVHGQGVKEAFYDGAGVRVVVKRRTGLTIYIAEPDHFVVGDVAANFNQAVNTINTVFAKAMLRRGYIMLHASAVLGASGGVAFASPSGFGKSTVALMLVERRQRLVTNDRLFVRPAGGRPTRRDGPARGDGSAADRGEDAVEMVGVPKRPRVNPGTLLRIKSLAPLMSDEERALYAPMTAEELWSVERKHDVDVDATYGPGTVRLRGLLRAVFLLRWSPTDRGWNVRTLALAERTAALGQMLKTAGVYDPTPPPAAERQLVLDGVARALSVYEVQGRADVARLADLVLEGPLSQPRAGNF